MFECGPVFDRKRSIRGIRRQDQINVGVLIEQLTESGKGMQTTQRVEYADQHLSFR